MTPKMQEAADAVKKCNGSVRAASEALGISRSAMRSRMESIKRWESLDPAIQSTLTHRGYSDIGGLDGGWIMSKDENGAGVSLRFSVKGGGDSIKLEDLVRDAIADAFADGEPRYEARELRGGNNLLVMDLADIHVGKLCVESETGYTYNREVAIRRIREGTAKLLHLASGHDIGHIVFVLGNDILQVDNGEGKTTSGTGVAVDGSVHTMYTDAFAAYIASIEACAKVAKVSLIFNRSNHDDKLGWALANSVGAWFRNDDNVTASEYNLSQRHRKYIRFENNIIGMTHLHGGKIPDLQALMVEEARIHISECQNMQWYIHHGHRKIKLKHGEAPLMREQDLIGMSVVSSGATRSQGSGAEIEMVRSMSPPDDWHSLHGFINKQAVECFVHHPQNGKFASFTSWF